MRAAEILLTPLLLGLPGDNTFRNYQEANRAFWRQTVIPLVVRLQKAFQAWAQPGFGPFRFDYNIRPHRRAVVRARGGMAPHRRGEFPHQ